MARRIERARSVAVSVWREIRREDVTFMAASIAYHAFVSMLPVLLLLMLVVSAFGRGRFDATVFELTTALLPAAGQGVVADALRNATAGVGLSVVGVGVLLWGTSKVFRAMDAAFAEIYDTERRVSLLDQFRDAIVVLFALAIAAVGAVVLGTLVSVPPAVPFAGAANHLLVVLGLAVAFFPVYYVFPNTEVSIPVVLPGVLVAAVGWVGLKWLFNLYVSFSAKPDLYGLVGTLLLLVTWLYVGGLVLLVGATVNATLAGRGGDRPPGGLGKRRFGRLVTDVDSFGDHLDGLVARARNAGVPEGELRRTLQRRAERLGGPGDGPAATATEDEGGPDRGRRPGR